MYTKENHSFTLQSGQIAYGAMYSIIQLSAKFQIWARRFGVTDAESLACWIANQPEKHLTYFGSSEQVQKLADAGFAKIAGLTIPDLATIPESEIRHCVLTIETK